MLVVVVYLATAGYSLVQTVFIERGIEFGGFQSSVVDGSFVLSIPLIVNNTGYYDITEFKIMSTLEDINGTILTSNSMNLGEIMKGTAESAMFNTSLSFSTFLSNMTYLLFNDTELKIDLSIGFRYAKALGFQLDVEDMLIPWGAPLYGLNITEIGSPSFNGTHLVVDVTLELENHSFFDVNGTFSIEAYNEVEDYIGAGQGVVTVPSYSRFDETIEVVFILDNPLNYTGKGTITFAFTIPTIDYSVRLSMEYG
jgi:hypothetical protein